MNRRPAPGSRSSGDSSPTATDALTTPAGAASSDIALWAPVRAVIRRFASDMNGKLAK